MDEYCSRVIEAERTTPHGYTYVLSLWNTCSNPANARGFWEALRSRITGSYGEPPAHRRCYFDVAIMFLSAVLLHACSDAECCCHAEGGRKILSLNISELEHDVAIHFSAENRAEVEGILGHPVYRLPEV
jgi:hypothetical protein